ncbi:hypothetical protein GCK72_020371 [Caenorhabditis remanei]|uniref:Glycosyltransferase family 92 protein n=1 Tax=Caenorhabditis remanei TaxID=31234 RepID=A0A6A5GGC8_CAERE|nr:hypothetical protein GCK72_020371 [Caenorhabditis remanei]KAF1753814.1 hypothetical protein GCK72_020371 [Caenorhabditis remanei]
MSLDLSYENNQNYTSIILIGAYVYPEYISITLNSQYMSKQYLYCRYFDCKRKEIQGSEWQGLVFPESVIHCPRRIGAEFVSVSKFKTDGFPTPMRLTFRAFEKPIHDFTICVAPLYGNEPKWIQITEFIEHHKMEGASFFYFHIGAISSYDRRILDEYVNNGDIEVKVLQEKYERPFYAWQLIEIQDCHMRAKYHSKWTAFIDIDERIYTQNGNILDFLNSEDNGRIAEIQIPVLNFVKYEDAPEIYNDENQLQKELISMKYDRTTGLTWNASKALVRPEKIGIMSIHYAIALEHGYVSLRADASEKIALRHYRSTQHRENGSNWDEGLVVFENTLPSEFLTELTRRVIEKVKSVYEKVPAICSYIPRVMWESREFPDPCEKMLLTW